MIEFSLTLLILLPFIVGGIVLVVPLLESLRKAIIFATLIIVMLISINLFFVQDLASISFSYTIIKHFGVEYSIGVDGVSLLIIMIVGLSFPPIFLLLSHQSSGYWGNMLLLQSSLMGVVLVQDLIMFYIFWEAMLVPIFIMIGLYGEDGKVLASLRLLLYTMVGSLFMLFAIIYLGYKHFIDFGVWSFAINNLSNLSLNSFEGSMLFFCFMLAFGIKLPLFPFHQWLSDGYARAPIGATFMLSAVASKVAVYAILRFVLPLFPQEFVYYADMFIMLGIFSMVFFAMSALAQTDLKRLLAYSSASHLGLIIAGIFALNYDGFSGSIYQIVAHALGTGFLFLLVAIIEQNTSTREIKNLGGIAQKAPFLAIYFMIGLFAIIGVPSTSGFVGEILALVGIMRVDIIYGVFGGLSIVFGAVYMLNMYKSAIFGYTSTYTKDMQDLTKKQLFALFPFIIVIFLLGMYPKMIQDKIDNTINTYLTHIHSKGIK